VTQQMGSQKRKRSDANMDRVRTLVRSDWGLGVRLITKNWMCIAKQSEKLLWIWEWEKFQQMVPRILTDDQKQCRFHISSDLSHNVETFALPVMKCGFINMTWKQNARACSEKYRTRLACSSNPCLCVSLITRG
jgi:hypothetical protein